MPGMAAAARALRMAAEAWRITLLRSDEAALQAVEAARAAVDKAQEKLDACYEKIELTPLPPDDFEALIGKHPPREDTDDTRYNKATFPTACFLACAPADLSEQEWIEFLKSNVSSVERDDLLNLAVGVNVRRVDQAVPKD
jgi:hypothetical protein